jgi:Core-2/I-Branching enzyme
MSMCEAEQRLLANALLDWSNERFVLLSESCIPLFPFPVVYKYLIEAKHSFVGSFDDPSSHGRGRYNPKMAPEVIDIDLLSCISVNEFWIAIFKIFCYIISSAYIVHATCNTLL